MPEQILAYREIITGDVIGKDGQGFDTMTVWQVSENCKCLDIEST